MNPFSLESIIAAISSGALQTDPNARMMLPTINALQESTAQKLMFDRNAVMTPEEFTLINARPYAGEDLVAQTSGWRTAMDQAKPSGEFNEMLGTLFGAGAMGGMALAGAMSGAGTGLAAEAGQGMTTLADLAGGDAAWGANAASEGMSAADAAMSGIGSSWEGAQAASSIQNMALAEASGQLASGTLASVVGPETANAFLTAAQGVAAGGNSAGLLDTITNFLKTPQGMLAGANLLSSGIGALGSYFGSRQQADAAREAAGVQRDIFNTLNEQGRPYREAGYSALNTIKDMQPFFNHQFNASDLNANLAPNWAFSLEQGQRAIKNAANAQTGLVSGNAMRGLADYTLAKSGDLYQQAFNNYTANQANIFNRLSNIAGLGNQAFAAGAGPSAQLGGAIGQNLSNVGTALGGGTVGMANALSGGLTNAASWYALPSLIAMGR